MTSPIETAIFALLAPLPAGKSIDPSQVAQSIDPEGWRRVLPQVSTPYPPSPAPRFPSASSG